MSSEEEDFKPNVLLKGEKRTSTSSVTPSPKKQKNSTTTNTHRQAPPQITPDQCNGPRDNKLLSAYLERLVDESSAEHRNRFTDEFGVDFKKFNQAWRDSLKFRAKGTIRLGLTGEK